MLANMKDLLLQAKTQKQAIGAFNTPTLNCVRAVIKAAEKAGKPIIIQHAQCHEEITPLVDIGPIMMHYARKASVPVGVHVDHGESFAYCKTGIEMGFTSIMYDASTKPFMQNLTETQEITEFAHSKGVSVEAELGTMFVSSVGGGEGRGSLDEKDFASLDDCYTNPEQAKQFVDATNIDALAIAFGTVHGVYLKKPELNLNRILEIKQAIDLPFVMHGGSGVSDQDMQQAIRNGIAKVNYYTYMAMAGANGVKDYIDRQLSNNDKIFSHDIEATLITAMQENALQAINVFSL